jgi:hypothetical protein
VQRRDGLYATILQGSNLETLPIAAFGRLNIRKKPARMATELTRTVVVNWTNDDLVVATTDMLSGRSGPPRQALGCQSFYAASADGFNILIPAQELIRSLFGLRQASWGLLFSPRPPLVIWKKDRPAGPAYKRHGHFVYSGARAMIPENELSWVANYPSAWAGWGSVFVNALDGRLALDLPKARYTISLTCFICDFPRPVAFGLKVRHIEPLEDRFDGDQEGDDEFSVSNGPSSQRWPIDGVPKRGNTWECSDEEWLLISSTVLPRIPSKHRLSRRRLVDLILERFGRQIGWLELRHPALDVRLANSYCRTLRQHGRLDRLFTAIRKARAGKS